ncbi:ribulose-phosphate 3-epimerase [[Mycoplasma] testudinis]|uniref:ribulose-phosphate 3-epimerase n=1 Tax=[Mycoplasma] testudinis TaxID=33924 RepID=UPI00055C36D0|nr:ribulose-phosphate 3-epimerase [[Mycoplasma] testudinis]
MQLKKIAFSVLPLRDQFDIQYLKKLRSIGLDTIHYDVMDEFTGTKGFDVDYLPILHQLGFKVNIHLMVSKIATTLLKFTRFPANRISFHVEALANPGDVLRYIEFIKNHNYQVGLAFKMETDLEPYAKVIGSLDYLTFMSVHPGLGGQQFNPKVFKNILQFHKIVKRLQLSKPPLLEFDGGIGAAQMRELWKYGDIFVSGSYFHNLDMSQKEQLLKLVQNGTLLDLYKAN